MGNGHSSTIKLNSPSPVYLLCTYDLVAEVADDLAVNHDGVAAAAATDQDEHDG